MRVSNYLFKSLNIKRTTNFIFCLDTKNEATEPPAGGELMNTFKNKQLNE